MPSISSRTAGPGLRTRVMLSFAIGAALVSLLLAVSVYVIARGYLVEQREQSAQRQAAAHAAFVQSRLERPNGSAPTVLDAIDLPAETALVLRQGTEWFTSTPGVGPADLPDGLLPDNSGEEPATASTTIRGVPHLAVAIGLARDSTLYELVPLRELQGTLRVLSTVLIACAVAATLGGALLGLWASRRVLQPLRRLAGTAAQIADGALDTRLAGSQDRDLAALVTSFNRMVESLQLRIERERRFFGDVSHELRTPLTSLTTSVEVLRRHQDDLPDRYRRALGLVSSDLTHLRHLLDDLLALARTEASLHRDEPEYLSVGELLTHTLADSGRPTALLTAESDGTISGRKLALERAFVNLMDNADQHGGGLLGVTVRRDEAHVQVLVDDAGAGVPVAQRDRIFERFATAHSGRRGSAGTGLGLALVAETITAHGGQVRCDERPEGGARFVVTLPLAEPEESRQRS